jgi:peptide/nickel transport system permease protein
MTESGSHTEKGRASRRSHRLSFDTWYAFSQHRLGVAGLVVVLLLLLVAALAEFVAPYGPSKFDSEHLWAPPQGIALFRDVDGAATFAPAVYAYDSAMDEETLEITYTLDLNRPIPVGFFVQGAEYRLWGLFKWDRHLIGPIDPAATMYLAGTDSLGRDLFSRIIYGTRISLTIGLVGVALSFVLGVALGGVSGYFGGRIDTAIQRVVEFFMSIPTLPLWLGLAAALPRDWGPLERYFAITVILAIVGWTDLARVTRGRFLALRREEFVTAARLDGNSHPRVIFRHMLPSFTSHLIAALTLTVPSMILAETSLSFLGLGLQEPIVSWGVLLQDAQNVRTLATAPWLMLPGAVVVIAVLALNFMGDGLRDAADPYRK